MKFRPLIDRNLGFPYSFGVFQEYYSTHPPFSHEPSGIAVIGSSAMVSSYTLLFQQL